jgi:hypothetical protein
VVVLEASGALTVGQHDHIQELLERLQRIEAAVTHGHGSGSALSRSDSRHRFQVEVAAYCG